MRTAVYMDTTVAIEVVGGSSDNERDEQVARAFAWFEEVERRCSRFDPGSELSRLSLTVAEPTPVSGLLWHLLEFAFAVAAQTGGAFDPTVGAAMESNGFDRNYRTGEHHRAALPSSSPATFRDVVLDPTSKTVTLRRPLVLDLGAVAKGFAMDLASLELADFPGFAINAGGDLLVHGHNLEGQPWRVGIRHPRELELLIETVSLEDGAVCTSGDYERPRPDGDGHHIVEPASGGSARLAAGVTAIAPSAVLADAIATAAFVMGPERGVELFERHDVEGVIFAPDLTRRETAGFRRYRQ